MTEDNAASSPATMELEFIEKNGGKILLWSGFQYILKHTYKNGSAIWECRKRKHSRCTGSLTIDGNKIVKEKSHLCSQDFAKNEMERKINQCKAEVCSENFPSVPETYNKTIASLKDSGMDLISKVPPFSSKKSYLYRQRNKSIRMIKTCFTNVMDVQVPPKHEKFLLGDYKESGTRVLLFATDQGKRMMAECKSFYADGTFKSCPVPFAQVYTVHGDLGSSEQCSNIVPLVYALLSDKTAKTYQILFEMIKSQIPEWIPTNFKTDYEKATMKGLLKVFPDVTLSGCYFHFKKAVWKKGSDLGLTKNKVLRKQVALCSVLPLLPESKIIEGWFYIAEESPDDNQSQKFRTYMLKQWIENRFFDKKIWCVFGQQHRTTNFAEAWHNKLNKMVGKKQPNIVHLLNKLQDDASFYDVKALRVKNNMPVTKRVKKSVMFDQYVHEIQMQLVNGMITTGHFLEKLR